MKKILKILTGIILAVIVFGIGFILTLHLFEYKPEASTPLTISNQDALNNEQLTLDTTFKIMTFNTGYASLSETEDFVMDGGEKGRMDTADEVEDNMEGIASILTREAPDIVLLQEVDTDSARSYEFNQYAYYEDILGKASVLAYNYRCIFVPFPLQLSQMMGKVNSGIATYTTYTFSENERIQLPGEFSWPLRLANLKRCILISEFAIDGSDQSLIVINVHMSAYDDGSMREQETEALLNIMTSYVDRGDYVIVGGDFNQTLPGGIVSETDEEVEYYYPLKDVEFWSAPPLNSQAFLDESFQFGVDYTTPTCRLLHQPYNAVNTENNQYYLIDGFIVSANVTIQSIQTLDENFVYSDHNPVVMEFILN